MPEESQHKKDVSDAIKVAIITAVAAIVTTLITIFAPIIVAPLQTPLSPLTPTAFFAPSLTPLPAPESATAVPPTPIPTSTPYFCAFAGKTDGETIVNLIQAEATASNTKDLATMLAIFDPQAVFYDYSASPTKQWIGPAARYQNDLFQTTGLQGAEHFDISPVGPGIAGDAAYYVSGSKGNYRVGGGAWTPYFNGSLISTPSTKYGSEHWILKKNTGGCWVILQMEFNAGHIKFPNLP